MKFHVVVLLFAFANISIVIPCANGFNVETKHFTMYREETFSMFGFSVAEHQDRDRHGWVIVGAPEAQTQQQSVTRGGAVYRCDIYRDNSCQQIYFDPKGNSYNINPNSDPNISNQLDNKTLQWFGASVSASQTIGGPILACAPRYLWFGSNLQRREPVGTCYITKNSFSEPKEFSPCRTRRWGYHRQGSCQAGMSAALSKDGERVLIGAPGSYYWQGQVYSVDSNADFPYIPPRLSYFGESSGQAFSSPVSSLPIVMSTKESKAIDDDSYLGYSVATGNFEGNGQTSVAVGMPRGANLQGKVLIYAANLTTTYQNNLSGTQMGEYFGYSVIACDVDGDGLDDLVVGAPMYTMKDNPEMTYETGRVHIFYQGNGPQKFIRTETRDGVDNRGRFGLSLASLNDINRDGYGDFAVGAPYAGPKGRGAVYIYHGSANGVLEKYSQAIYAEQVNGVISTFGFSVAGGLDLDGNQYPDVVIGAYDSGTAAFFRSRPVIKIEAFVAFDSKDKSISLEDKNCVLNDQTQVPCLKLDACLSYSGIGTQGNHQINIQYVLDSKKSKNPRLFFVDYETRNSINQTVSLTRDQRLCKTFRVYVTPNIRDKLTSIDAEMRMSLIEDRAVLEMTRNPTAQLTPVLGATTSQPDSLSIYKKCGEDNVCIPNLQLKVTPSVEKYLLGSGDKLELEIVVQNSGEDAFEATYNLKLPTGIDYIKIERIDKTEIPVQCSAPKQSNNNTLRCDIGNPLPGGDLVHFKVILQPVTSQGMEASFKLDMAVNTTNPENAGTQDDNTYQLNLPIWVQTELIIEGKSRPKDLYFDFGNYTSENVTSEWEFGPLLTHNYTIRNDGPSNILEAEAFLVWSAQTLNGEEFIYLLEQPETSGPIKCETANANYLSLVLDQKRRIHVNYEGAESAGYSSNGANKNAEEARINQRKETGTYKQKDYDYGSEVEIEVNSSGGKQTYGSYTQNKTSHSESGGAITSQQNRFENYNQAANSGGGITSQQNRFENYNEGASAGGGSIRQQNRFENYNEGASAGGGSIRQQNRFENYNEGANSGGGITSQQNRFEHYNEGASAGGVITSQQNRFENYNEGASAGGGIIRQQNRSENYNEGTSAGAGHAGKIFTGTGSGSEGYGGEFEMTIRPVIPLQPEGGQYSGGVAWSGGSNQQEIYNKTEGVFKYGWRDGNYKHDEGNFNVNGGFEHHEESTNSGSDGLTEDDRRYYEAQLREKNLRLESQRQDAERRRLIESQKAEAERQRVIENQRIADQVAEAERQRMINAQRQEQEKLILERDRQHTVVTEMTESERQELLEKQRTDIDRQRIIEGRLTETEREYLQEFRRSEVERQRASRQRYYEEQERVRQESQRRLETERQSNPDISYGVQRHYATDTENSRRRLPVFGSTSDGVSTNNREHSSSGNSGLHFQISNIGSSQDLEKFFSNLNTQSAAFTTHSRDEKQFALFDGRFRVAGDREYIEFRNGEVFELQDSEGAPIYTTGRGHTDQFVRLEGQLMGGEDGKIYIQLSDGRRFQIPGTYSYQKQQTFTVGGGPRGNSRTENYNYGSEITHEGGSQGGREFEPFRNKNYHEESYEENYTSAKKVTSGSGGTHYESRGTFNGDNVPTDRPENRLSRYPRETDVLDIEEFREIEKQQRRQREIADGDINEDDPAAAFLRSSRFTEVDYNTAKVGTDDGRLCTSAKCVQLKCTLGPLDKGQEVWIAMRSRVKAKTLNEIAFNEKVRVSTKLVARVTRQPFIGAPIDQLPKSHEIYTTIYPTTPLTEPDVVPLWVVVLSACAGTIILLLLIFLLYKCGFFKRNRPTDAPERQPLNRNGHYPNQD
ncbi:integrin alpha-PS2 isoform X1 [Athalia rosae]|uniref:integrin alpha-PS2 isoform X1 n=1 Tax=Athalia rosae TaxID=37344 RepID=UPI0020335EAF|nr:integrin alpha-PS2 isoform X1 [Athalia rosae]